MLHQDFVVFLIVFAREDGFQLRRIGLDGQVQLGFWGDQVLLVGEVLLDEIKNHITGCAVELGIHGHFAEVVFCCRV